MKKFYRLTAVVLGALSFNVLAQSTPGATDSAVSAAPAKETAAAASGSSAGEKSTNAVPRMPGTAVSTRKLNAERGKADTVSYDTRLDGVVTGNSASNVATGSNSIDTGSFANMMGLPVVIQNSGANVLIQNSTIVNVQFR